MPDEAQVCSVQRRKFQGLVEFRRGLLELTGRLESVGESGVSVGPGLVFTLIRLRRSPVIANRLLELLQFLLVEELLKSGIGSRSPGFAVPDVTFEDCIKCKLGILPVWLRQFAVCLRKASQKDRASFLGCVHIAGMFPMLDCGRPPPVQLT